MHSYPKEEMALSATMVTTSCTVGYINPCMIRKCWQKIRMECTWRIRRYGRRNRCFTILHKLIKRIIWNWTRTMITSVKRMLTICTIQWRSRISSKYDTNHRQLKNHNSWKVIQHLQTWKMWIRETAKGPLLFLRIKVECQGSWAPCQQEEMDLRMIWLGSRVRHKEGRTVQTWSSKISVWASNILNYNLALGVDSLRPRRCCSKAHRHHTLVVPIRK